MKKLLCVLLATVFLAGCTNTVQPTPTPVITTSPTPTETPSPTPVPYEDIVFDDGRDRVETMHYLDVEPRPGSFSLSQRLEQAMEAYGQNKYYYVWVYEATRAKETSYAALYTEEEILDLHNLNKQVDVCLTTPPRPEGYPETVGDALAYLLENGPEQTYHVGVFHRDSTMTYSYSGHHNMRKKEYVWPEGVDLSYMLNIETQAECEAYMNEKVDDLLSRYGITDTRREVCMLLWYTIENRERMEEVPQDYRQSLMFFEAEVTREQLLALAEDEDVAYIDWKLEDGKLWMP